MQPSPAPPCSLPMVSTPLMPRAATLMTSPCASMASLAPGPPRVICPASPVWRMSIVPPSARRVPFTLALLLAPVAKMVTLPPGPGAAASRRERSWPVLEILMATPLGFPLLSVMFPPLPLRRRAVVTAGSAEEACTRELIATASFTELNVIAPPLPIASSTIQPAVGEPGRPRSSTGSRRPIRSGRSRRRTGCRR